MNESGLHKLAARSDKPQAKLFMDWVTRDVLPSIRKTGTYALADHGRDQMPGDVGVIRVINEPMRLPVKYSGSWKRRSPRWAPTEPLARGDNPRPIGGTRG